MAFKARKSQTTERQLLQAIPPAAGNVKERLQFKPMLPGKKKPAGENWRMKPERNPLSRNIKAVGEDKYGPQMDSEMVTAGMKRSGYDDVNGQEHASTLQALSADGYVKDRDALADRATESYNEHLYEEVEDKQTGHRSLLFRNNIFDRI